MRGQDFTSPRELASGSCQLLRRAVLGRRSVFDESFPIYWNDALLARELTGAGHQLWMIPDAVVTHSRGASCSLLGPSVRFRHLIGGLVSYLDRTGPHYRVAIFRAVMIANHLLKTALGRTTPLGWADLRAALRGDLGPLPDGDTTRWAVVVGQRGEARSRRKRSECKTSAASVPGRPRTCPAAPAVRHPQVAPVLVWQTSLPAPLPLGRQLAAVSWLNRRIAAAQLRQWLDGHAGARTLHVSHGGRVPRRLARRGCGCARS